MQFSATCNVALRLPKPAKTRLIQVDVDPAELHKNYRADVAILSDIKLFLQALLRKAPEAIGRWRKGMGKELAEEIWGVKAEWLASWKERLTTDEVPMNPYRVCWDLGHLLDRHGTIMLHDAGTARVYIAHHYETLFPIGFHRFRRNELHGLVHPGRDGGKADRTQTKLS